MSISLNLKTGSCCLRHYSSFLTEMGGEGNQEKFLQSQTVVRNGKGVILEIFHHQISKASTIFGSKINEKRLISWKFIKLPLSAEARNFLLRRAA